MDAVNQFKEIGYAYLSAAAFMVKVARENVLNQKAVDAHNKKLIEAGTIELQLAQLQAKLAELKAK